MARTGNGSEVRCERTKPNIRSERANPATRGRPRMPRRPAPETSPSVESNSCCSIGSITPEQTEKPCCSMSWIIRPSDLERVEEGHKAWHPRRPRKNHHRDCSPPDYSYRA